MSELQKLPAWTGPGGRPETGPMQFDGDWPGVFIRGDGAFGYRMGLQDAIFHLENNKTDNIICLSLLRGLANLLASCHASNFPIEPKEDS